MPGPPPGPTSGPQQGSGGSKKGWLVGLAILVVAATAGGGFLLTQKDDDNSTGGGGQSSSTTTPATPDADALAVEDNGGSHYVDKFRSQPRYGYAVVVRNTADQAATDVAVTLDFLDADGKVLATTTSYIHVLPAKAQMGVAGTITPGLVEIELADIERIDHLEVRSVEPTGWAPMADQGKVVASNPSSEVDDDGLVNTSFEADSTYKRALRQPTVTALYRNAAGDLIGGDSDISLGFIDVEGHFAETLEGRETLGAGIDADKTEVYVDPHDS